MADRSRNATRNRPVLIDFVRIGNQADVTCLRQVFQDARVCDSNEPADIGGCVAWGASRMAVRYIQWRFGQDTARAAGLLASATRIQTRHQRPSKTALPATAARSLVDTCWDDAQGVLPDGSRLVLDGCLPARGAAEIAATVVNGRGRWHDWIVPTGGRERVSAGEITIAARLEPATEIRNIGLSPQRVQDRAEFELAMAAGGPVPVWGYLLAAIALIAGLFAVWWTKLPPIPPTFKPTARVRELGHSRTLDLDRHRTAENTYDLPMPGTGAEANPQLVVEIRRRGRFDRKDVEVCITPPESDQVRVAIAKPDGQEFRVTTVRRRTVVSPGCWIIWDDGTGPWDRLIDRTTIRNCLGYEIAGSD